MTSVPVAWFAEASLGKPTARAIALYLMTLTPKPATALGKIEWETVYHGDHALIGSRSRQTRRLGLGKIEWETVYHGDSARKSGNRAKTGDSRATWGNSNGNPFIMATTLFSDSAHAKIGDRAWENSKRNPFIMAISPEKAALTLKPATFDRLGENRSGTRLSWRSRNRARSDWRSDSDRRNYLDWSLSAERSTTTGPYFFFRRSKGAKS